MIANFPKTICSLICLLILAHTDGPQPEVFLGRHQAISGQGDYSIAAFAMAGSYLVAAGSFIDRVNLDGVILDSCGFFDTFIAIFNEAGDLVQVEHLCASGHVTADRIDLDPFGLNLIGHVDGISFKLPLVRHLEDVDFEGCYDLGNHVLCARIIQGAAIPPLPFTFYEPIAETGSTDINPNGQPPEGTGASNDSGLV